jgi:hypothetical protein
MAHHQSEAARAHPAKVPSGVAEVNVADRPAPARFLDDERISTCVDCHQEFDTDWVDVCEDGWWYRRPKHETCPSCEEAAHSAAMDAEECSHCRRGPYQDVCDFCNATGNAR